MLRALARDFRSAPVTFSLLAVAVALFVATELHSAYSKEPLAGHPALGAIVGLSFTNEVEVHGPFALWDGPWWRWLKIPISAFHHGNLLHLVFNVSSLWYFGPLLERRLRRVRYLAFWFFAATVPFVVEYYMSQCPIGLSGVACAMFGWCLWERHFDMAIAHRVHEGVIRSTWFFLFGCIVTTAAGWIPIANVAHFVGVGYGWLNARAAHSRTGRTAWVAGHLLLPVAIWGAMHPIWNSRYHVFMARQLNVKTRDLSAGTSHLRQAVALEPLLPRTWETLSHERMLHGDTFAAWKFAAEGLFHNRSDNRLENLAQLLWPGISPNDRAEARRWFETLFNRDASFWVERLRLDVPTTTQENNDAPVSPLNLESWKQLLGEPSSSNATNESPSLRRGRKPRSPAVNPDDANSAAEGQML